MLNKVLREEESRPELFAFLYHSIQFLDLMETGIANFHLLFLLQLSRYLGFAPTRNYSAGNLIFFDMIAGKYVGLPPDHQWFLKESESSVLSKLLEMNYQNSSEFKADYSLRNILLTFILDYFGLHIGSKLNIKSLEVLKLILH